mgnify:CR=1 FL=1
MMAMTMFNRARWTRKPREAEIFRQWILARLADVRSSGEFAGAPTEDADEDLESFDEAPPESRPSSGPGADIRRPDRGHY